MEPRARIGRNLDTSKRGPPLNKLVGYEHREDAAGGWGEQAMANTHTNSVPVIHKVDRASGKDRTQS